MKQTVFLFFLLLTCSGSTQDVPDITIRSGNFVWINNQVSNPDAYVVESNSAFSDYHMDLDRHMPPGISPDC